MDIEHGPSTDIRITSEKKPIVLTSETITIDGMAIDCPGEYEKSDILVHREVLGGRTLTILSVEGSTVAYIPYETIEIDADTNEFLGQIDILLIAGGRSAMKAIEAIDARVVIPIGDDRSELIATIGQDIASVEKYRPREADLTTETTVFIHLG